MKKYIVFLRANGYWETEVEAESRAEAIDIAYDDANAHGEPDWEIDWVDEP